MKVDKNSLVKAEQTFWWWLNQFFKSWEWQPGTEAVTAPQEADRLYDPREPEVFYQKGRNLYLVAVGNEKRGFCEVVVAVPYWVSHSFHPVPNGWMRLNNHGILKDVIWYTPILCGSLGEMDANSKFDISALQTAEFASAINTFWQNRLPEPPKPAPHTETFDSARAMKDLRLVVVLPNPNTIMQADRPLYGALTQGIWNAWLGLAYLNTKQGHWYTVWSPHSEGTPIILVEEEPDRPLIEWVAGVFNPANCKCGYITS